jgi:hypothetical protein
MLCNICTAESCCLPNLARSTGSDKLNLTLLVWHCWFVIRNFVSLHRSHGFVGLYCRLAVHG